MIYSTGQGYYVPKNNPNHSQGMESGLATGHFPSYCLIPLSVTYRQLTPGPHCCTWLEMNQKQRAKAKQNKKGLENTHTTHEQQFPKKPGKLGATTLPSESDKTRTWSHDQVSAGTPHIGAKEDSPTEVPHQGHALPGVCIPLSLHRTQGKLSVQKLN